MKIILEIQNEEGEVIFTANCLSVDSAIAELGRFERSNKDDLLQQDSEKFEKDADGYREARELIRQDEPDTI